MDAILRNLRACICTEFLVTCAEIFTKALPANAAAQGTKSGTSIAAKPSTTSQAPAAAAAPAEEGTKNDMQIKAILQNPEIILVADSSTKDTNALILQVSMCKYLLIDPSHWCRKGHRPWWKQIS